MRRFRVIVNGLAYEVDVEEIGEAEGPAPSEGGRSPAAEQPAPRPEAPPAPRQARAQRREPAPPKAVQPSGDGAGEVVTAPLPGTVLDVKVAVGDRVAAGEVLLILGAMKMENEIVAPADGTIAEILVETGGAVGTGDALIRLG